MSVLVNAVPRESTARVLVLLMRASHIDSIPKTESPEHHQIRQDNVRRAWHFHQTL